MNGKSSIDFDGAELGQYPQYPTLSTNKASCSYEYTRQYYRTPKKKEIAEKFRTYRYNRNSYEEKVLVQNERKA